MGTPAEEIEQVEQSSTETDDFVPIPEATDEDLDAFLKGASGKPPVEEATEKEESDTPPAEEPTQEAKPTETVSKEEYERLKADLEKKGRQVEQQERFINQQKQRLGEARKERNEALQKLQQGLEERATENPVQAMRDMQSIQAHEEALRQIDAAENQIDTSHEAQKLVNQYLKPEDIDIEAISQSLYTDGIPPEQINEFRANPAAFFGPVTFIQVAKRAKAESYLRRLIPYVEELKTQIITLKGKPGEMLKGVEKELRKGPPVTASKGNSSAKDRRPNVKPENMTDKQIEEYLADQAKREASR